MADYVRPDLIDIAPAELSDYLLDSGIHCRTHLEDGALHITTDSDASALLEAFVPTSTLDRSDPESSTYVPKVPTQAAIAQHLQHLKDFRNTVRNGGTPPTLAQTQHVIADVIDALRLLDSRLDRDL